MMLLLNQKQSVHFINRKLIRETANSWMSQLRAQYKFPLLRFKGFLFQSFISV
jgi:hypothetical protein